MGAKAGEGKIGLISDVRTYPRAKGSRSLPYPRTYPDIPQPKSDFDTETGDNPDIHSLFGE